MSLVAPSMVLDLLATGTLAERVEDLTQQGLADEAGLAWVLDRVDELVHEDPGAAEELTELCDAVAGAAGLDPVQARARYLRARIYAERGELSRALGLIESARAGWSRAGMWVAALRTDLGRMQILDDLGRHQDAARTGESLLAELDQLDGEIAEPGLLPWLRAAALENLGVAWSFTGQHERAVDAYAEAEASYRAIGRHGETARPAANRGIELLGLGRAREALAVLTSAAAAFDAAGDRLWSAKCQGNVAQAHVQLGELVHALNVLEPARAVLDELGATAESARLQLALAATYLDLGLFEQAHSEAAAAAGSTETAGMRHDTATARFTLGLATLNLGDLHAAGDHLQAAARLFDEVADRPSSARTTLARARVLAADGRRGEAREVAGRAVSLLRETGRVAPLVEGLIWLAELAEDEADAAVQLGAAAGMVEDLRMPLLDYHYALASARLDRRRGEPDRAEALLRKAIEVVEQLGASLPDHRLQIAFRTDRLAAYDELVDLLATRGRPGDLAQACQLGDRAKAATLSELVAAPARSDRCDGGEAKTLSELHIAQADLNATYFTLHEATDVSRRELARRQADTLEGRIAALRLRLASTPGPVTGSMAAPAGAGQQPGVETTTLAYHVVNDDILAFVLRSGETAVRRLAGATHATESALAALAAQWTRFGLGSSFARRHQNVLLSTATRILEDLHGLLIEPVQHLLSAGGGDELVVVPHGRLGDVPFHALTDGASAMVDRWALTIAPAFTAGPTPVASTASRSLSGASAKSAAVLVLAVSDSRAPAVESEAAAIAEQFPAATVLLAGRATSVALAGAVPGPAVLHVACHGMHRAGNPLFSSLRLADRWLTVADVLELDLDGALVTLSACESGRHGHAIEPVGLAWAFLAAGASGVIVSRWVVHDDTTRLLMTELYRQLADGLGPAQALRRAQRSLAQSHPHPFYWAPFSYVAWPERPK